MSSKLCCHWEDTIIYHIRSKILVENEKVNFLLFIFCLQWQLSTIGLSGYVCDCVWMWMCVCVCVDYCVLCVHVYKCVSAWLCFVFIDFEIFLSSISLFYSYLLCYLTPYAIHAKVLIFQLCIIHFHSISSVDKLFFFLFSLIYSDFLIFNFFFFLDPSHQVLFLFLFASVFVSRSQNIIFVIWILLLYSKTSIQHILSPLLVIYILS